MIAEQDIPLYLGIPLAILCITVSIVAVGVLIIIWRELR